MPELSIREALPKLPRVSAAECLALAHVHAPDARAHIPAGVIDDGRRWYTRLMRSGLVEVWLLGWSGTQATDFHDHGGSSGAVVVVEGELVEEEVNIGLRTFRTLRRGDTIQFEDDTIHDVRNSGVGSSLSVHVYSPPLTTQTFYDVAGSVAVARETVIVDGPEY